MRDVEHSAVVFVDSEVLRAALIVVEIILGAVAVGLVRDLLGGEALRQRKLDGNAAVEHVVGDILGFAFLFTVDVNGGSRVSFKGQGSVVGIAQGRSNGLDSDIDYNGDGIAFIELGSLNTSISNQLVLRIVGQSIRNIFDSGPADDSLNSIGISSFNALINGNSDFISHDDGHFIRLFIGHHIGVTSLIGLDDIVVIVNISAGVNGEVTAGDSKGCIGVDLKSTGDVTASDGSACLVRCRRLGRGQIGSIIVVQANCGSRTGNVTTGDFADCTSRFVLIRAEVPDTETASGNRTISDFADRTPVLDAGLICGGESAAADFVNGALVLESNETVLSECATGDFTNRTGIAEQRGEFTDGEEFTTRNFRNCCIGVVIYDVPAVAVCTACINAGIDTTGKLTVLDFGNGTGVVNGGAAVAHIVNNAAADTIKDGQSTLVSDSVFAGSFCNSFVLSRCGVNDFVTVQVESQVCISGDSNTFDSIIQ